jgi:hypothetical protein
METQYYVPKISEFHYGFDFETKENDKWIKLSFWEGICLKSADREWLNEFISNGEIRVKCLDKQDIIDLGFKTAPVKFWENTNLKGWLFGRIEEQEIYIDFFSENKSLIISTVDEILFKGTIKNKSELKRIMQMLKIIE